MARHIVAPRVPNIASNGIAAMTKRRIATIDYVAGETESIDLKKKLSRGVIQKLVFVVRGTIVKGGAGAGVATGTPNPEGLITALRVRHTPGFSLPGAMRDITARGLLAKMKYQAGRSVTGVAITDDAVDQAVEFDYILSFVERDAANPIEYALPLSKFNSYIVEFSMGSRATLFTGGGLTMDFSNLKIDVYAYVSHGLSGKSYNLVERFEQLVPFSANRADLPLELEAGYLYPYILLIAERDNVPVDDILNGVHVFSGEREWFPEGQDNAARIQRDSRHERINSAAESVVGEYWIPAMENGLLTTAIEATDQPLNLAMDVTSGGGVERIRAVITRVKPFALRP